MANVSPTDSGNVGIPINTIMRTLLIVILLFLSGCEYRYRYPCQDPQNWKKIECQNMACKVEGECTEDTLGYKPK